MSYAVSYFLELRLRVRGNREATAIVDRCLRLISMASTADEFELRRLECEVSKLGDELALRFGAPPNAEVH